MDLLKLSKNAVTCALDKLIELDKKHVKDYKFSKEVSREVKAEADIIIEKILIDRLSISDLTILSEESGIIKSENNSNLKFIIDPIDGTVNFVRGICNCSISVALFDGDSPVFGVLASYPSRVIAWGGKDMGTFVDDTPISVSSIKDTNQGVLCTGFPSRFEFNSKTMLEQTKLMQSFNKVRMLGSASQSLLKVAQGSVEAYAESNIKIKMKMGYDSYTEKENQLMRTLLDKYKYTGVAMVFGEFSDYLNNAECVVGYIGSAIVESIFRNVPFYVYEPKSLGMTDSFIEKSVIIDRSQIARDLVHLKKSISTHNSVILDKDKIFDGINIDEIDFIGIATRFNSHPLDITS